MIQFTRTSAEYANSLAPLWVSLRGHFGWLQTWTSSHGPGRQNQPAAPDETPPNRASRIVLLIMPRLGFSVTICSATPRFTKAQLLCRKITAAPSAASAGTKRSLPLTWPARTRSRAGDLRSQRRLGRQRHNRRARESSAPARRAVGCSTLYSALWWSSAVTHRDSP